MSVDRVGRSALTMVVGPPGHPKNSTMSESGMFERWINYKKETTYGFPMCVFSHLPHLQSYLLEVLDSTSRNYIDFPNEIRVHVIFPDILASQN